MKINKFEILFDTITLAIFWFTFGISLIEITNGNYINEDFIAHFLITIFDGLLALGTIFVVYFDFKKLVKYIKWLENSNDEDEVEN